MNVYSASGKPATGSSRRSICRWQPRAGWNGKSGVPLDTPGIEIQGLHTVDGARTNITYYSDVRIPDRYRLGDVNGRVAVQAVIRIRL